MAATPRSLNAQFLQKPLLQDRNFEGFGTLFSAEYDPVARSLGLTINGTRWDQRLDAFREGRRVADYENSPTMQAAIVYDCAAPTQQHRVADDG